jgi:uncharacterized membrane protein
MEKIITEKEKFNLKFFSINLILVLLIVVFLSIIMSSMFIRIKNELLEERFRTTVELINIRCEEIKQTVTVEYWEDNYDYYVKGLSIFIQEIDKIPFTMGAVYDRNLNLLSDRFYNLEVSDDEFNILHYPEVVHLIKDHEFGIKNVKYPVKLLDDKIKLRDIRVYFHKMPDSSIPTDNYLIVCIGQSFDDTIIKLPNHFTSFYIIMILTGISVCLFIVIFIQYLSLWNNYKNSIKPEHKFESGFKI